MVSIGSDHYQNSIGGSDRLLQSDTTHLLSENEDVAFWNMEGSANGLTALTVGDDDILKFHPIRSIPVIITVICVVVLNVVLSVVLAEECRNGCLDSSALSWIAYLQIFVFLMVWGADLILQRLHYTSRSWGYLEFYRRTRFYRRFSLNVISMGTAAILFVVIITERFCTVYCVGAFSRANAAQIVISFEAVLIIGVLARYSYICRMFNKSRPSPDVLREDLSTERILQTSINHGSQVGFKDATFKETLLEKQADEILYLQKRNAHLSSRILLLTRKLNAPSDTLSV